MAEAKEIEKGGGQIATPLSMDKESILQLIHQKSIEFGVSEATMLRIIKCENPEFNPMLQSYIKDPKGENGREDSWGLVQIFLPSHPEITKEMAQDPIFSLSFLAENLKKNKGSMWSCYKIKSPVKDV